MAPAPLVPGLSVLVLSPRSGAVSLIWHKAGRLSAGSARVSLSHGIGRHQPGLDLVLGLPCTLCHGSALSFLIALAAAPEQLCLGFLGFMAQVVSAGCLCTSGGEAAGGSCSCLGFPNTSASLSVPQAVLICSQTANPRKAHLQLRPQLSPSAPGLPPDQRFHGPLLAPPSCLRRGARARPQPPRFPQEEASQAAPWSRRQPLRSGCERQGRSLQPPQEEEERGSGGLAVPCGEGGGRCGWWWGPGGAAEPPQAANISPQLLPGHGACAPAQEEEEEEAAAGDGGALPRGAALGQVRGRGVGGR